MALVQKSWGIVSRGKARHLLLPQGSCRNNTIQYNTIQYNTIQYNTIQYNTIQYNTIQCNIIQYNTICDLVSGTKLNLDLVVLAASLRLLLIQRFLGSCVGCLNIKGYRLHIAQNKFVTRQKLHYLVFQLVLTSFEFLRHIHLRLIRVRRQNHALYHILNIAQTGTFQYIHSEGIYYY